jgi:hypothetical protein
LVVSPVAVYLMLLVPLSDLIHPLVVYPLLIYAPTRTLGYPSLLNPLLAMWNGDSAAVSMVAFSNAIALYFPWLVCFLAVALYLREPQIPSSPCEERRRFAWLAFALVTFGFAIKTIVRPHLSNLAHVLVPSFILLGMLCRTSRADRTYLRSSALGALFAILALAPLYSVYLAAQPVRQMLATGIENPIQGVQPLLSHLSRRGNGGGVATYFDINQDQAAAVAYLQSHTTEEQFLFVASGRHDLVFANDVLFYFLAQRRPATKFYEFDPGVTTTPEIQSAIIRSLQERHVPYVVRARRFDDIREPNRSAESSGEMALDLFLSRNYRPVASFGKYEIAELRDVEAPRPPVVP